MSSFTLANVIAMLFSAAAIPAGRPGSLWDGGPSLPGDEPLLDDMLADPIMRRMMASDGVRQEHLLSIIEGARRRLGA